MALSEENKERVVRLTEVSKTLLHWTWVPLIIYVGYTASTPRPPIMRIISPFS